MMSQATLILLPQTHSGVSMGKKSPTEVWLVIRVNYGGSGGSAYADAAFTTRQEAMKYRKSREAVETSDHVEYELERHDLLTHAPAFHDVYVVKHRWTSRNLAAMSEPKGWWERVFHSDDHQPSGPWARRPTGGLPQVALGDEEIAIWGVDDEACWERFYDEADKHGIPYFGPQGSVNAPDGLV